MKVLFVASECAPFVKTGGLADVIGAVPKSLDADVRVLIPAYPALSELAASGQKVMDADDLFGGPASVVSVQAEGLDLLLLHAPHLFDRPGGIYLDTTGRDWNDNHRRFGALSLVGASIAAGDLSGWQPDVVNAHDWQAGLVPAYLKARAERTPPVVITIHNIAFQGVFAAGAVQELGVSEALFNSEGVEYFGHLSFLKGGIALADKITTVSPTYARELMSPEFGMGLEGLLRARQDDLTGILNGIDLEVWNPQTDPNLPETYTSRTLKKKARNRAEIEARFDLTPNPNAPLFCVVSRLTEQKGLDMLLESLPALVGSGARLALLGSGEPGLERAFIQATQHFKGSVGAIIGYDEALSHLLQGGSDAILIPSRFEPCGLTQLYGLRYGTVPVVARTGGLADTVIDANEAAIAAGCATGFQFSPITSLALSQAIQRTCSLFRDKKEWATMMRRGMRHPVGWEGAAGMYLALYENVAGKPGS